ncbi:hypothetical protein L6452_01795 [Arctium lappa]|uniref:Uncharacterized protein n=1 Tax=Arctium lappa TaxID=4217 RepID=A0ACB9FHB3_ARCLA|nr:hypothetical protein L6452_01795 [Arctium lappa]
MGGEICGEQRADLGMRRRKGPGKGGGEIRGVGADDSDPGAPELQGMLELQVVGVDVGFSEEEGDGGDDGGEWEEFRWRAVGGGL